MFIPQKPYLVLGTLRDQIIYPHEHADMQALGVTDDDLAQLLAIVDPARNITTEWKWSATNAQCTATHSAALSSQYTVDSKTKRARPAPLPAPPRA